MILGTKESYEKDKCIFGLGLCSVMSWFKKGKQTEIEEKLSSKILPKDVPKEIANTLMMLRDTLVEAKGLEGLNVYCELCPTRIKAEIEFELRLRKKFGMK